MEDLENSSDKHIVADSQRFKKEEIIDNTSESLSVVARSINKIIKCAHPNTKLEQQIYIHNLEDSLKVLDFGVVKEILLSTSDSQDNPEAFNDTIKSLILILDRKKNTKAINSITFKEEREEVISILNNTNTIARLGSLLMDLIIKTSFLDNLKERGHESTDSGKLVKNFLEVSYPELVLEEQRKIYNSIRPEKGFTNPLEIPNTGIFIPDMISKFGTEDEKKVLTDMIYNSLTEHIYGLEFKPQIYDLWLHETVDYNRFYGLTHFMNEVRPAFNRLKGTFENYFGFALQEITKGVNINLEDWPRTVGVISSIEQERPGGTLKLSEMYGIKHFFRYSPDILIKQIDEEEKDIPYGIAVYASDDHNNAFAKQTFLTHLSEGLARGGMALKIVESGSGFNFAKQLLKFDKKYGHQNKLSFLIVSAHGQENDFLLSERFWGRRHEVNTEMLEGEGVKRLAELFVTKPDIILLSCSTGASGGIGEKVSRLFNAHVIAPDIPTGVKDVSVKFGKDNRPEFDVVFSKEESLRKYG